jgi:hypothetical protein
LLDLLEAIRVRYAEAARRGNDLMSRLEAIQAERSRWQQAREDPALAARARMELNEIDRLRPGIERSAHAWVDKARALELVVAAYLRESVGVRDARPTGHTGEDDVCSDSDASTT